MDWGIVSQVTFFLGTALLAIVVTIFVFASSLLGRAVEAAARKQAELQAEKEQSMERQISEAQKELDKARKTAEFNKAKKFLDDLEKEKKRFEKESKAIQRGYSVFGVGGGVVYPGLCFLACLILSGLAWSLASAGLGFWLGRLWFPGTPCLWGIALISMACGIHRLYFSLKKIQEVAITSEEAALKRTVEAFKIAQKELEDQRKPKLALVFKDKKPPFDVEANSTVEIKFAVGLVQGDVARKPEIWFFIPQGFAFVNSNLSHTRNQQSSTFEYPNYLGIKFDPSKDYKLGVDYMVELSLKMPPEKGSFTLAYQLICEGFVGKYEEFELIVH